MHYERLDSNVHQVLVGGDLIFCRFRSSTQLSAIIQIGQQVPLIKQIVAKLVLLANFAEIVYSNPRVRGQCVLPIPFLPRKPAII